MTALRKVWSVLGSMRLAVCLLAAASALFFAGSIRYGAHTGIFASLNSTTLFDWLGTYGLENPGHTWWLFLLPGVLFLLAVNTGICTVERTVRIIRSRGRRSPASLIFLLSPHIMHLAFLAIIAGYFLLYTSGINSHNNILKPGIRRHLPGSTVTMELSAPSFSTADNKHNEALKGIYVDSAYTLVFHDGNKAVRKRIGLNRPCFYKGYSIHVADFSPKWALPMADQVWVNLTIRKNAGIPVFVTGVAVFAFGVLLYLLSTFVARESAAAS